jgi:hypothetical protein
MQQYAWSHSDVAEHFWYRLRTFVYKVARLLATDIRYKFKLPTYIQEPLMIARRGYRREIAKRKRLAADNGSGWTLAVEYESGVNEVVESVIT